MNKTLGHGVVADRTIVVYMEAKAADFWLADVHLKGSVVLPVVGKTLSPNGCNVFIKLLFG